MSARAAPVMALLSFAVAAGGANVAVDPKATWGAWEGWGTSLAWWAAALGDREDLADMFFSLKQAQYATDNKTYPGLGLNIARYNAGASTWKGVGARGEKMVVSPNINPSRLVEGYWVNWDSADPASPSWNWSADAKQRQMLKLAVDRGADKLELFSNSPIWWMCTNHNPSGNARGEVTNLQDWNHRQHAEYLAVVAAHFRDVWGVVFESVEPFNEPSSNWWSAKGSQEGCHFGPALQSAILPLLQVEMAQRNLTSFIAGADENSYDLAIITYKAWTDVAKAAVQRVNVHGYEKGGGRRDVLYDLVHADGKRLWNTEYGEGDASGVQLASNLMLDFKWLHNTAWVYWQAADGGGWGLIEGDNNARTTGRVNNKYFVLAQFTRHIRPGATIVTTSDSHTVAAHDPARSVLTLVTTALSGSALEIDLRKYASVDGGVDRWVTAYDGSVQYRHDGDLAVKDKQLAVDVAAGTIVTLEVHGVAL